MPALLCHKEPAKALHQWELSLDISLYLKWSRPISVDHSACVGRESQDEAKQGSSQTCDWLGWGWHFYCGWTIIKLSSESGAWCRYKIYSITTLQDWIIYKAGDVCIMYEMYDAFLTCWLASKGLALVPSFIWYYYSFFLTFNINIKTRELQPTRALGIQKGRSLWFSENELMLLLSLKTKCRALDFRLYIQDKYNIYIFCLSARYYNNVQLVDFKKQAHCILYQCRLCNF